MLVLVLAVTMAAPASASDVAPGASGGHHGPPSELFPTTIPLPDGFQPEGITIGSQPYAYFSSLDHGSIYRANLVTGRGDLLSEGPGTASVGLELDSRGRLFVAGGDAGDTRVVDARTGELLASYQFASDETFVNDVILTPDAAWFTDSFDPVLYKLPLDRHGALPHPDEVVTVPLTGDIVFQDDFNSCVAAPSTSCRTWTTRWQLWRSTAPARPGRWSTDWPTRGSTRRRRWPPSATASTSPTSGPSANRRQTRRTRRSLSGTADRRATNPTRRGRERPTNTRRFAQDVDGWARSSWLGAHRRSSAWASSTGSGRARGVSPPSAPTATWTWPCRVHQKAG